MSNFPTLTVSPKIDGFTDEYSRDGQRIADPTNGYPLLIRELHFNPRYFRFTLYNATDEDKTTLMDFYDSNKDKTFNWTNEQDSTTYEVMFAEKPKCQLNGQKDRWNIELVLVQAAV